MSDKLLCRNRTYEHECDPRYAKSYDGYCLDCSNAGVPEFVERIAELERLINCPHNDDWFDGVRIEAAHQQERWGAEHDAGKEPQDWFWLIGYLAGKCLRECIAGSTEKAKHHTISTAAVLLNWYRRISGENGSMRPGIEPPKE